MAVTRIAHTTAFQTTSSAINTTGATLILFVVSCITSAAASITDSVSNTYTGLNLVQSGARILKAYYVIAPTTNASHTFTIGSTGGAPNGAVVALDPTSPVFDTQNAGASTASATLQPGSLTPGGATNLILSVLGGDANTSIAINSPYNIGESQINTPYGPQGVALGWFEQASATAQNPTWTVGANGLVLNAMAFSFTFTGGGAPPFVCRPPLQVKQAVNRAGTY